jgi:1-acyl-sn-glycerol-3-phosphate acyltransferase
MELVREAKLGAAAPSAERAVASEGERLPLFYDALRAGTRRLLESLFALEVPGLERLPADGAYIVAANHHNYLDGIILCAALPRRISFLVMPRVYRATPLHPLLHRWAGSILLNLERPDAGAIRRALGVLDRGGVVGIFPEGPFSVRGRLERGLPGVALLALRSGAPVVPIGIQGTYEALAGRRLYVPRRHPLRVRVGVPRAFAVARHAADRATREEVTRRIMADIAALLS